MNFSLEMYCLIAVLSLLNFVRVLLMLICSDVYDIKQIRRKIKKSIYNPSISVIVPAYNEEAGVIRTVQSIAANNYRQKEIIVVNDGSTDQTLKILKRFQRKNPGLIKVINQKNAGKAAALNRAISRWSKGSLIMVVDADSLLHPAAIDKMVAHFRNRRIIAAASNVKIISTNNLFGLAQRFEYLISYRMKRALSTMNVEYIVGGVGSTFRKSALLKVGMYDIDTMTEDIDLTIKLIREYGNKYYKVHYAADSLTYTEHVISFRSLVKQRFRWKYGRFQTLLKNQRMLFSRSKKYDKKLTWYQLPYSLFGEAILLFEPILVGYILYVTIVYADISSLLSVYLIVSGFVFLMLLGEESERWTTKLSLALVLPVTYFMMYVLTAVEFVALLKSLKRSKKLIKREAEASSWQHVERSGEAVVIKN